MIYPLAVFLQFCIGPPAHAFKIQTMAMNKVMMTILCWSNPGWGAVEKNWNLKHQPNRRHQPLSNASARERYFPSWHCLVLIRTTHLSRELPRKRKLGPSFSLCLIYPCSSHIVNYKIAFIVIILRFCHGPTIWEKVISLMFQISISCLNFDIVITFIIMVWRTRFMNDERVVCIELVVLDLCAMCGVMTKGDI